MVSRKGNRNRARQSSAPYQQGVGVIKEIQQTISNYSDDRIPIMDASKQLAKMTKVLFQQLATAQMLNRRVKTLPTPPQGMTDEEYIEILNGGVLNHELQVRALSYDLGAREYTYKSIIKTYQDILTYRIYCKPTYGGYNMREYQLLDQALKKFKSYETLHWVNGLALIEGKPSFYHSYKFDKSHNICRENRLIRLPADHCMIISESNPISKYTIAFDMMYFTLHPEAIYDFGDLFAPWFDGFTQSFTGQGNGLIFDIDKYRNYYQVEPDKKLTLDKPNVVENGLNGWNYWVALPIDRVWTFEIDDTNSWNVPIFTGLFRALLRLEPAEQIFLELLQNPLINIMTGEIGLYDDKTGNKTANNFKVNRDWQDYFGELWHELLSEAGAKGIPFYPAPFSDLKMHKLDDAQHTDKILSSTQRYAVGKSGLLGVLPSTDSVLAAQVITARTMTAAFSHPIYATAEAMLNQMTENLNLKHSYNWKLFGDLFRDTTEIKELEKALTLGITCDLWRYNALKDRTMLDDEAMSQYVMDRNLARFRTPLISSYHSRTEPGASPDPAPGSPGRPRMPIEEIEDENTEAGIDKGDGF